ncbi:DUF4355 domain-containing protein [Streptomyces synnematoformans]
MATPTPPPAAPEPVAQPPAAAAPAAPPAPPPPPAAPPPAPAAAPAPPPAAAPPNGGQPEPQDWEAEAEKWKALARKHEKQHLGALGFKSKDEIEDLRAAAKKYAEFEEAQKTEIEKATDRAQQYEQQLAAERAANARLMAAATHGIPPELIELLGSGSHEEINARAEVLAERLNKTAAPAPPAAGPAPQRPVESLTPGAAPASTPAADPDAWIRKLAGR